MTAAIALFGNRSFISTGASVSDSSLSSIRSQICQQGKIPFSNMFNTVVVSIFNSLCDRSTWSQSSTGVSAQHPLLETLYNYTTGLFSDATTAQNALSSAMFFAIESQLGRTAAATAGDSARVISTSRGTAFSKPYVSNTGIGIISALIGLQLAILAALTVYIYRGPTWTSSLDALAVAKIAAYVDKKHDLLLKPDGDAAMMSKLEYVDGLERRGSKATTTGLSGLKAWKTGKHVVKDDDGIALENRSGRRFGS
jgi:hypothetical protein